MKPFTLNIPQEALDDLERRLENTRWPEQETDSSQGVPLHRLQALVEHWRTRYDWRRCEAMLNGFGQFTTEIDGLEIHFLHVRSPNPQALPLLLTHGWPGSVVEFHKVIAPLSRDFHLVIPSLPGYGFSGKPTGPGWGLPRIAAAWAELMARLGYSRYGAQGGDWGAGVTIQLGRLRPAGLVGIHINFMVLYPPPLVGEPDAAELATLGQFEHFDRVLSGYAKIQSTRPQTIGYSLTDSPVGLAAWIYEKFADWTDPASDLTPDEILDDVMLYWLPATGASAARLYWESFAQMVTTPLELPVGCTVFPHELNRPPRVWAERTCTQLVYWNEAKRGGHFAAFEQPELFIEEVRACFERMRHGR